MPLEGEVACTHGPDPAPAGIDVRDESSGEEARSHSGPSGGLDWYAPCVGTGTDGRRVS